jgi:cytochrome P450
MTKLEIMKNSGILIIAGSETTATLLSGVTFFLLKNPRTYEKVRAEVRGAFSAAKEMTLTSTSRLLYLHACLNEALRLYPPVPIALPRRTGPEEAIIDGHFIPGT